MAFVGLCGRYNPKPCRLVWASSFPNKVGSYPSQLLPSKRTVWWANAEAYFSFSPPVISPGDSFGLPFIGGLTALGLGVAQFDTWFTHSHYIICFAQTVNRLNLEYTLTAEDFLTFVDFAKIEEDRKAGKTIDEAFLQDRTDGTILLDFGTNKKLPNEYIFEVIAVADSKDTVSLPNQLRILCPRAVDKSHVPSDPQKPYPQEGERVKFTLEYVGNTGKVKFTVSAKDEKGKDFKELGLIVSKSGGFFPVGRNQFTATITDESGRSSTCSFYVTIKNIKKTDKPYEIIDLSDVAHAEDLLFRDLFELDIPDEKQRFVKVMINRMGLEYRLDNARDRTVQVIDDSAIGDLSTPSYRDGTSKVIEVNVKKTKIDAATNSPRSLQIGDKVYISYVGIVKHYIRQRVDANWSVTAMGLPAPMAFAIPGSVKVASFRFYEWDMAQSKEDEEKGNKPLKLGAWRVVETFNTKPHVIGKTVGESSESDATGYYSGPVGDFGAGGPSGVTSFEYLPAIVTPDLLKQYTLNKLTLPTFSVNFDKSVGGDGYYHLNCGDPGYRNAEWYKRASGEDKYIDGILEHVFFNVHPRTMKKRDLDKWGIHRFMATEVEKDIKAKKPTGLPFMDDPELDDPENFTDPTKNPPKEPIGVLTLGNPTTGARETLNSSNCLFQPILPVSRYGSGNVSVDAATGGGILLGTIGGFGDVIAVFNFGSNIITEKFDKGTRILVERAFTYRQRGSYIAIQGVAGAVGINAITCIQDPSKTFSFAFHVTKDNFITCNDFMSGYLYRGMRSLDYRPDIGVKKAADENIPKPSEFEPLVGPTGMLGDYSGIQPGRLITTSAFIKVERFFFYTTKEASEFPKISADKIKKLEKAAIVKDGDVLTINLASGYYCRTEMTYSNTLSSPTPLIFVGRIGGEISVEIDGLSFNAGKGQKIIIDHRWANVDQIDFISTAVPYVKVESITCINIDDEYATDFLEGEETADTTRKENTLVTDRPILFKSDIISVGEDKTSGLFLFFNDAQQGISCVWSRNFGQSWVYHFGIIEKMDGESVRDPFVISHPKENCCFVFYRLLSKLMCKRVDLSLFSDKDSFLIEQTEKIVTVPESSKDPIIEKAGLYTNQGKDLRRRNTSYIVAGDLTDENFLKLLEKRKMKIDRNNERTGTTETTETTLSTQPLTIGGATVFANQDISTPCYSGYRKDNGEMRMFFLGEVDEKAGGGNQLQCHFSTDNGASWFNLWEYQTYQRNRVKVDEKEHTIFIDRTITDLSKVPESRKGTDPKEGSQKYEFGLNIHKTLDENKEVVVNEVFGPYVLYQSKFENVLIFYIIEGCLLCKRVNDAAFSLPFGELKSKIEDTKSEFIDGFLYEGALEDQLDKYITFQYRAGLKNFNEEREIEQLRICACELPNGNVRVFYKLKKSSQLKAAIFNGSIWMVEEMFHTPEED